ncbi:unnamed protein product [Peniophora sp. CBMAI 1063]|nr:unnamed protein product [Peniophora sp. CBMAI 1063]
MRLLDGEPIATTFCRRACFTIYNMLYRIYAYSIGLFARLLEWLGFRSDRDSSPTRSLDTECAGPVSAPSENTALLSQPEDNEQNYLTGPDPPSRWRPSAYDYREQSTPSTPSFQSAARVPLAGEDASSSEESSGPESESDEPPPFLTRGKATRPSSGYSRPSGRVPSTAKPVRPIAGSTGAPVQPRPPPQPQYPRPHH